MTNQYGLTTKKRGRIGEFILFNFVLFVTFVVKALFLFDCGSAALASILADLNESVEL